MFGSVWLIVFVTIIENALLKYLLAYTYERYLLIILCQNTSSYALTDIFLDRLKYLVSTYVFVCIRTISVWKLFWYVRLHIMRMKEQYPLIVKVLYGDKGGEVR